MLRWLFAPSQVTTATPAERIYLAPF